MTIVIIGILVLAWVAFLAPTLLRARSNQVRSDSVGDFHHRLRALGRTNGHRKPARPTGAPQPILGPVRGVPGSMSSAQKRRRDVLLILAGTVAVTFVVAVLTRMPLVIGLQLLADAALAGYVYLLIQHKERTRASRRMRPAPRPVSAYVESPAPRPTPVQVPTPARLEPRLVPLRASASN